MGTDSSWLATFKAETDANLFPLFLSHQWLRCVSDKNHKVNNLSVTSRKRERRPFMSLRLNVGKRTFSVFPLFFFVGFLFIFFVSNTCSLARVNRRNKRTGKKMSFTTWIKCQNKLNRFVCYEKKKTKNQPFLNRKPNARQDEGQTRKREGEKKQVCMCGTSQRWHTLPWGKKTKEVSFIKNTEWEKINSNISASVTHSIISQIRRC